MSTRNSFELFSCGGKRKKKVHSERETSWNSTNLSLLPCPSFPQCSKHPGEREKDKDTSLHTYPQHHHTHRHTHPHHTHTRSPHHIHLNPTTHIPPHIHTAHHTHTHTPTHTHHIHTHPAHHRDTPTHISHTYTHAARRLLPILVRENLPSYQVQSCDHPLGLDSLISKIRMCDLKRSQDFLLHNSEQKNHSPAHFPLTVTER